MGEFLNNWFGVIASVVALLLFFGIDGKALLIVFSHSPETPKKAASHRNKLVLALIVGALIWSVAAEYRLYKQRGGEIGTRETWDATNAEWRRDSYRYETVVGKTFRNEIVPLDGRSYSNCQFFNVTFEYNGTGPVQLLNNAFHGDVRFTSANPRTATAMGLVAKLAREAQQQGAPFRFMPTP
jgi:hypothetical protein